MGLVIPASSPSASLSFPLVCMCPFKAQFPLSFSAFLLAVVPLLPGHLLASAPLAQANDSINLQGWRRPQLFTSLLDAGSALLMPFLQMTQVILSIPMTETLQPLKVACSNA